LHLPAGSTATGAGNVTGDTICAEDAKGWKIKMEGDYNASSNPNSILHKPIVFTYIYDY
jgi:hypothetical protein